MIWLRWAAFTHLCVGMFLLGLALSRPPEDPSEHFGVGEAVVLVALWPVILVRVWNHGEDTQ